MYRVLSLTILISLLGVSCQTASKESALSSGTVSAQVFSPFDYQEFVPIDPLPSPQVTFFEGNQRVTRPWNSLTNEQIRKLLPNQTATIVVQKLDQSTNANYLSAGITREAGRYRVVLDYLKFVVEDIQREGTGQTIGQGRIGVGLRIKAEVLTTRSEIDLGSLISIGVSARQGHLRGMISVDTIGLDSPEINHLFPLPSKIDETSIQKSLEALAAIKSQLSDTNTTLTPQVIAVKITDPGASVALAQAALTGYTNGPYAM